MLTPDDIKSREFLVSLRGYDRDEVHSFLDQVAQQVMDLQARLDTLQAGQPVTFAAPTSATDTSAFFADLGKTTQRILEAAHDAGSEIQRRARSDADQELADARSLAAKLVAEGQRRREVIEGVVHMLEERRGTLADDLRDVAQTVEQVLTDLAPRGHLLSPDELLAVAQITAPDQTWVPDEGETETAETEAEEADDADEEVEEPEGPEDEADEEAEEPEELDDVVVTLEDAEDEKLLLEDSGDAVSVPDAEPASTGQAVRATMS